MTTATLTADQRRNVALFSAADSKLGSDAQLDHEWEKGPNGHDILILKRVPLFRSGEFADSLGYEHLWEEIHLQQMEMHFNLLKDSKTLPNIPVREDHLSYGSDIIGKVIGYHRRVWTEKLVSPVDGIEYTYLMGDLEIIKKEAQDNILSGLYRTRSAEIGPYVSNGKAEYWPTFMGVAYVDMPAVEGLEFNNQVHQHLSTFTRGGDKNFALMMEERMEPATQPAAPGTQAPAAPAAAPAFNFRVAGRQTTDFAAVQAYIDQIETRNANLEAVQTEQKNEVRASFAKSLVTSGKILPVNEESTVKFCQELSDEMFASYKSQFEGAPAAPVMGQYGAFQAPAPGSQQGAQLSAQDAKINDLKEQVSMHRASGLPHETIKNFQSYKDLVALVPTFSL